MEDGDREDVETLLRTAPGKGHADDGWADGLEATADLRNKGELDSDEPRGEQIPTTLGDFELVREIATGVRSARS